MNMYQEANRVLNEKEELLQFGLQIENEQLIRECHREIAILREFIDETDCFD